MHIGQQGVQAVREKSTYQLTWAGYGKAEVRPRNWWPGCGDFFSGVLAAAVQKKAPRMLQDLNRTNKNRGHELSHGLVFGCSSNFPGLYEYPMACTLCTAGLGPWATVFKIKLANHGSLLLVDRRGRTVTDFRPIWRAKSLCSIQLRRNVGTLLYGFMDNRL